MSQKLLGTVLSCGRFGCVVRLEDGRFAILPVQAGGSTEVRRATGGGRRPRFEFLVEELERRRLRVSVVQGNDAAREVELVARPQSSTLEEKIIDYLRQTAEWDPDERIAQRAQATPNVRADRLLPFEVRARRQYRESPKRPPRPKR